MATFDLRVLQADGRQVLYDVVGGMKVTGPVKLAQRFVIELMTEKGSLQYLPDRGTNFLKDLRLYHQSEADVIVAFSSALVDIERNLREEEEATDPASERYFKATLDAILVADGAVELVTTIYSRANTQTTVTLPVLVFNL